MPNDLSTFPVLSTSRLDLIEADSTHLGDMFRLFTDTRVTQYYHVIPINEVKDLQPVINRHRKLFEEKSGIRWGIALKGRKDIIGSIGFNSFTPGHRGTIVYALMPEYWNQGYITEAIEALMKFGFEELGVNRIDAEVMPGNDASARVLEKVGFTCEGLLRQWSLWQGKYHDVKMFSRLKGE